MVEPAGRQIAPADPDETGAQYLSNHTHVVYVIGAAEGPQKIGITKQLKKRLSALECGVGAPLNVATSFACSELEASQTEQHAHWILREFRLRGEWFNVTPELASSTVHSSGAFVRGGGSLSRLVPGVSGKSFHEMLGLGGYSRPWLARHVGLSRTMVDRWCAGQSEPPPEVVAWLERRLADPPPRRAA